MPERFDELTAALRADAGQVRWADPGQVRGRGASRTRRTVLVAGVATLLVISGGVAAGAVLADRDGATPTPPAASATPSSEPTLSPEPTASPGRTASPQSPDASNGVPKVEVPDSALLQPEDMGPGYTVGGKQGLEDGQLAFLFGAACEVPKWTDTYDHRVGYGNVGSLTPPAGEPGVRQMINRYESGQAERHMKDLRAIVERCADMSADGTRWTLKVVMTGFAGDEAIVVRVVRSGEAGPQTTYHVFVREGDLVTELWFDPGPDSGEVGAIGAKAGARLCGASSTPTC